MKLSKEERNTTMKILLGVSKKSNEWKRENRDRVNASIRAKYAKNKEYYRQKQREYRARKRREAVVDGERNEAV